LSSEGNGKHITNVPWATPNDVDTAVKAAHAAWPAWKRTAPAERSRLIRQTAEILRANAYELAYLDSLETGNPVSLLFHLFLLLTFSFTWLLKMLR
jgi:acyl-CoA reductase-like NAD-dependent aldehyde dehydrogenase